MRRARLGRMAAHTAMLATAAAIALIAGACGAPGLPVATWHPAEVDAGAARVVRVTDALGRREDVAAAQDRAFDALKDGGWYRAVDGTRARVDVDADGRGSLDDGRALERGSLYLRLDVAEWFSEISQEARDATVVDDNGNSVDGTAIVDVTHAHADVIATLVRGDGAVLLDGYEVEGVHDEDGDVEESALDAAMNDAVGKIIGEITPRQSVDTIPFDDRDEAERPILDKATDDVPAAIASEDAYIAAHDDKAAPRYNRAVMLDASGDFDGAIAGYDDAMAHAPDAHLADLVGDARKDCIQRRDDARALGL